MAALPGALAGSGRNVQGTTAAPPTLFRCANLRWSSGVVKPCETCNRRKGATVKTRGGLSLSRGVVVSQSESEAQR